MKIPCDEPLVLLLFWFPKDRSIGTIGVVNYSNFTVVFCVYIQTSGAKADIHVEHGDKVTFGKHQLEIRSTPGHTNGNNSLVSFPCMSKVKLVSLF